MVVRWYNASLPEYEFRKHNPIPGDEFSSQQWVEFLRGAVRPAVLRYILTLCSFHIIFSIIERLCRCGTTASCQRNEWQWRDSRRAIRGMSCRPVHTGRFHTTSRRKVVFQ